ncbi:hypothetical protein DyAD56_11240 [Dyella sp. AD56]|uniref:hypothetical protein n=1 Tax=Dyella sp. AD56 TaxID=1528744 RepID=UPI000C85E0DE|nr:hypothetical protein [Dyella sp. AD56]PMQ05146.1 hypothetical protein DyAD56_11240 [Dyella sp. AD56]
MIPHLSALIEMNLRGEMPMEEIVAHVVKSIALEGGEGDFETLSLELKKEVLEKLARYQKSGDWFLVSNTGMENYGPYAEAFLRKIRR